MVFSKQLLSSIGCLLSLASLTVGVPYKPDGRSLKSRQAPYQTRILDTGTTFGLELNGVWQLIE